MTSSPHLTVAPLPVPSSHSSAIFSYIMHGSFGSDFCSMPESHARLKYESLEYEATPYEVCGPTCEEDDMYR